MPMSFFLFCITLLDREQINLDSLLRFVTGLSSIPPMGLSNKISFGFIKEAFPKSQACFCKLQLPTIHSSYDNFRNAFMTALKFGAGYGNV